MGIIAYGSAVAGARQPAFVRGADLSALPQIEAAGGVFRDRGQIGDALQILQARGLNAVRLRLWHSPPDGACGLAATISMARRVTNAGLPWMLDLHYSDTWADPSHQTKPAAWSAVHGRALADSVHAYTRDVLASLKDAGVAPRWVQLGNEVGHGLLWPDGALDGSDEAWSRVADLLHAAAAGAREGAAPDSIILLVHFEQGGSPSQAIQFFDRLAALDVPFDAIGLSYYPWWHGPLDSLSETMRSLAQHIRRDVYVLETAYPWTLGWTDATHNLVGERRQLLPGFMATVQGQRAFLRALVTRTRAAAGEHARGVFYWEPEEISAPGRGSVWENCGLFGADGRLLRSAEGLTGVTAGSR